MSFWRRVAKKKQPEVQQAPAEAKAVTITANVVAAPCHASPTEIFPNLLLGRHSVWREVTDPAKPETLCDVLVPLDDLSGSVWDKGWRGQIIYCPIVDYDILPPDVLNSHVQEILRLLAAGKRVAVFCQGGHGRTGYFAAAVLGCLLPAEDPIAYLREHYCEQAVESEAQVEAIAEYLEKPELKQHDPSKPLYGYFYEQWYPSKVSSLATAESSRALCAECQEAYWGGEKWGWLCSLNLEPRPNCPEFHPFGSEECPLCAWHAQDGCSLSVKPRGKYCEAYEPRNRLPSPVAGVVLKEPKGGNEREGVQEPANK